MKIIQNEHILKPKPKHSSLQRIKLRQEKCSPGHHACSAQDIPLALLAFKLLCTTSTGRTLPNQCTHQYNATPRLENDKTVVVHTISQVRTSFHSDSACRRKMTRFFGALGSILILPASTCTENTESMMVRCVPKLMLKMNTIEAHHQLCGSLEQHREAKIRRGYNYF